MSRQSELEGGAARLREAHARFVAGRRDEPAWLESLRHEALARFAFPTTRQEEWRYTNVAPIATAGFEPQSAAAPARAVLEEAATPVFACSLYVFVNGRFAPELSVAEGDAAGVRVESLARVLREEPARLEGRLGGLCDTKLHPFAALNTAFSEDGAVVTVPRGVDHPQPVHLVFVTTGDAAMASPRVLIHAESGSRGTVIQDHVSLGDGARFTNAVGEVRVDANARLELVLVQREDEATFHLSNLQATVGRDARFRSHTVTLGGGLVRNDLGVVLAEENAETELNGLFFGAGEQILDNHTLVDHAVPHGRSSELYKGILGGRSRGVFRGRVLVRPDAQKTDAQQQNPNLLLGDGAEIDTKPQLEIRADDVKCSHGSAIGRLDPDALFYLRSRGLGEPKARDLLTQGFAAEVLAKLPEATLAEALRERLLERLHVARQVAEAQG